MRKLLHYSAKILSLPHTIVFLAIGKRFYQNLHDKILVDLLEVESALFQDPENPDLLYAERRTSDILNTLKETKNFLDKSWKEKIQTHFFYLENPLASDET